ncbi:MAG: hypothetical protein AAF492_21795, partial [Verrucomicrobiota bacterium]
MFIPFMAVQPAPGVFDVVAVGQAFNFDMNRPYTNRPFGGMDTFNLASATSVYVGVYWDQNGGTGMAIAHTNGGVNTAYIRFGVPNLPPVVGMPIAGGSPSFRNRIYEFGASINPAPPPLSGLASDNCDPVVDVMFVDNVTAGSCPGEQSIERVWTATDDSGNSTICTQILTIVDTTDPVITCPADTTVACDASTNAVVQGMATATDNCATGAQVVITLSDSIGSTTCPQTFSIDRVWTADDGCGNTTTCTQEIVLVDNVDPMIVCPADITIDCDDSTNITNTGNATATDNCSATNDITITLSDSVGSTTCPNTFSLDRVFTATDECGNSTTCTQEIVLVDNDDPIITCPADITVTCGGSTNVSNTGMSTATDNCSASSNITITFVDVQATNLCPFGGNVERTWTATDECGNMSVCTQFIIIDDAIDFGDAPDPTYPTLQANDGARHVAIGPTLGTLRDSEADGQPDSTATGDDTNGTNDADGVTFGF